VSKIPTSALYGRDVLEIIEAVEARTQDPNAQLTLLTSAISLVAMHHGIRLKDLKRGLEEAYRQSMRKAPNFARSAGAAEEH
jgi:hypothetical protein